MIDDISADYVYDTRSGPCGRVPGE